METQELADLAEGCIDEVLAALEKLNKAIPNRAGSIYQEPTRLAKNAVEDLLKSKGYVYQSSRKVLSIKPR